MGMRKKINRATKEARMVSAKVRSKKIIKRAAKGKSAGSKLHDAMHGRAA